MRAEGGGGGGGNFYFFLNLCPKININFLDHYTAVNCSSEPGKVSEEQRSDNTVWSQSTAPNFKQAFTSMQQHNTQVPAEAQNVEPRDAGGSRLAEPCRAPERHILSSQPEARMPDVGYFCVMLHSAGHLQSQSFGL